ncbi:MAG: 2-oxo acid dehydrogenase subunit E2 [Erysipelotrichaceae bacterium]|nr:2-oxo acid dehydrogenase subunit E2 [Erysipelotrichaceae bacterium]
MRKDARRVKIDTLKQCMIDLKPNRKENEVYIDQKIDVTELVRYIEECKKKGIHYTYFHAFLTAIGKVMYNRPFLNRFIINRHMYEHNDVLLSFAAKIALDDKSGELMLVVPIEENDNIASISRKTAEMVDKVRNAKEEKSGANGVADVLGKLPNLFRVPVMALISFFGKRGLLPKSMTDNNIYFTSMIISNLGSIGCGAIYHNLADFGTCSSLTTIGEIVNEKLIHDDGTEELRKVCSFGVTLDERIADGFYFARSVKMIESILQHPEMLEKPAGTKITL